MLINRFITFIIYNNIKNYIFIFYCLIMKLNFKFLNICPEVVPALSSMASNEVIDKYQPQKHFFSSPKIEKSPKRCQNEITSISFVGK